MKNRMLSALLLIVLLVSAACASQPTPAPTQAPAVAPAETTAPQPTPAPTQEPTAAPTETSAPQPTPTEATTSFEVTDALGHTVTFQTPPQRIALAGKANLLVADAIYLFPQASERITVLGKGKQGTGNFLEVIDSGYEGKIKFDNEVGPEHLAAENPDAVILKSYLAESLGAPLEALGIPVIYVDFETPDQYYRDLATLGQLFQDEDRAQEVAEFYRSRVERITQKTSGLSDEDKPKTLLLYYSDRDGEVAFNVPPMNWMQTILVETAGGDPVWKDANLGKGWTKVTLEQVAAWDADQIHIISYFKPVDEVVELLKADPQWQSLRAVKEEKLYGFACDMLSWDQADTRWILGLTWLATKLHPELFADIDIQAEAQTFFTEMYGLSEASFQENMVPHFAGALP
jgi:iron complex transport system substrate-binding protein